MKQLTQQTVIIIKCLTDKRAMEDQKKRHFKLKGEKIPWETIILTL